MQIQAATQAAADPSTVVSPSDFAKWTKGYLQTTFDALSGFTYPFPRVGKKLSDRKVVSPPAVQKLDNQKISIKGYMLPIDMDAKGVTMFMLQADLQSCCFGVHGDPNTYILVTMAKKTRVSLFDAVTVYGTFHIGEVAHGESIEDIESFYRLDGQAIAIHTESFDKVTGVDK